MLTRDFILNAYLAGTFIALACGLVGWFVVLRGQVFAGDALTHVAFVGAIAAAVLGFDERIGLFAVTIAVAGAMAVLGNRGRADDVTIGIVFAWILGIGILLITILSTTSNGGSGITAANTLFGSIYSLSTGASYLAAGVALGVSAVVAVAARPLMLATIDRELAMIRGLPVGAIGAGFLGLLAVITAESTQAVGALLLLGLLAAPAGAAHRLTTRPYIGLTLSALLAVAAMWAGLGLSYAVGSLPPSSAIIAFAAGFYLLSEVFSRLRTG